MQPVDLGDDVVRLSPPTSADVDAITAACQDPEIARWTTVPSPYGREHAEGFVRDWVAGGWAEDRELTWAVYADGALAGMVGLSSRPPRAAEVGYWLAPHARGRGLLHRSLLLVLAWAFDDPDGPGLEQVEWRAFAGNWPSWRAAWAVGFRFEGAVRLGAVQRGVRRDDWVGSLLAADPREPQLPWPATQVTVPTPGAGAPRTATPRPAAPR